MVIDFNKFVKGKGVWRHPDHLLKEIDYVSGINECISETLAKNVVNDDGNLRFLNNQSLEYEQFLCLLHEEKAKHKYAVAPQYLLQATLNDIMMKSKALERKHRDAQTNILKDKWVRYQ